MFLVFFWKHVDVLFCEHCCTFVHIVVLTLVFCILKEGDCCIIFTEPALICASCHSKKSVPLILCLCIVISTRSPSQFIHTLVHQSLELLSTSVLCSSFEKFCSFFCCNHSCVMVVHVSLSQRRKNQPWSLSHRGAFNHTWIGHGQSVCSESGRSGLWTPVESQEKLTLCRSSRRSECCIAEKLLICSCLT